MVEKLRKIRCIFKFQCSECSAILCRLSKKRCVVEEAKICEDITPATTSIQKL